MRGAWNCWWLALAVGLSSTLAVGCGDDDASEDGNRGGSGGETASGGTAASGGAGAGGSAGCEDQTQNGDETDVDCGGSCGPCEVGGACVDATDCEGGNCVDGVCCDSACDGGCEACNNVGSEGQCGPIEAGLDPNDACSQGAGAETCDGASLCHCANGVQDADEQQPDCGGSECDSCWHFFAGFTAAEGVEVWKTDGTDAGTELVKDINPGGNGITDYATAFVWMEGEHYFVASDGVAGRELWKTDGTEAGTVMVKDIDPVGGSWPRDLTVYGGELFFSADDGTAGRELWKSDGTEAGTVMLKDIRAGVPDSDLGHFREFNGLLYFSAEDGLVGDTGNQLWRTDGTEAGTVRITSETEGYQHGNPNVGFIEEGIHPEDLTPSGNMLYFSAWKYSTGRELWVSDGTNGSLLKTFWPDNQEDGLKHMIAHQGGLLVSASGGVQGDYYRLYGYTGGSFEELGYFLEYPVELTPLGGEVLFAGAGQSGGNELWKSDGTIAGTQIVKDIVTGSGSSDPQRLLVHGSEVYFWVQSGTPGLWKTDGTDPGTVHLADVPFNIAASFRDLVLFRAPCELWKSDGTPGGTELVTSKVTSCPP